MAPDDDNETNMTYELINQVTSNSVAAFAREQEALEAFQRLAAEDAGLADSLLLVAFNDEGEAVEAVPARQRVARVA